MTRIDSVLPNHPTRRLASQVEIGVAVLRVARALNAATSKDTLRFISETMLEAEYTAGEVEAAALLIPNDAELAKEVSYAGGPTPGVFAAARLRPRVMAGRLFRRGEALRICGDRPAVFEEAFRPVRVETEGDAPDRILFRIVNPKALEQ